MRIIREEFIIRRISELPMRKNGKGRTGLQCDSAKNMAKTAVGVLSDIMGDRESDFYAKGFISSECLD